ncbi:hypothetical protein [Streptomyces reniochalinae]|uniref:Uncharacterized protein n=1 Tax=Streptomyces reniochalinae TaxID=2250578 RepID=A0A367EHP0_9ACTN|nr:hypothetical protein [Streptomyces reniochalinae]RCG17561.1 hypothetical protein DQ392_17015 [Streptomyces reniochalinae]
MFRVLRAGCVLAAGAALIVVPAHAVSAAGPAAETGASHVLGACAELTDQGPGWALLRNDCGAEISGSVQLSSGASPQCVPIPAHGTSTVRWRGNGTAEYAYDCLTRADE